MFNYIDALLLLVIIFFCLEASRHGFWVMFADFLSFLGSLLLSLKFYSVLSRFVQNNLPLGRSVSNAVSFLLIAIFVEGILAYLLGYLISFIPKNIRKAPILGYLTYVPAAGEAVVIVSFILLLLMGLPVSPKIKVDISSSKYASYLVERTQGLEVTLKEVFGGAVEDTISYMIVKPENVKRIALDENPQVLTVDPESEAKMFEMVSSEREKQGVKSLILYTPAVNVARAHARDMWERRYFGHISPDGEDVGDRLTKAGIDYFIVGENLALAPTVSTAMTGLMNSEGHRRNILDPQFDKLSIGVVDNGIYGKMFVQIFIK